MATTLITSHATLKTVVAQWLNRGDLTDNIGNFIQNGEDALKRDSRVQKLIEEIYTIIEDNQATPSGFSELDAWWHDGPTYWGELVIVEPGELGELKGQYGPSDGGPSGAPSHAAIINGKFRFAPVPEGGAVAAEQTLTFTDNPADADTVTIGSRTYTFKDTVASEDQVHIGSDLAATISNLVAAINDSGGGSAGTYHADTAINADVYAEVSGDTEVVITAKEIGDEGNDIATTDSCSVASWGAATMADGVNAFGQFQTKMTFWKKITPLVDGTNWLVEDHPDIYLYASLVESAPFLKDDSRLMVWRSELDRRLFNLGIQVDNERFGGNIQRQPSVVFGG